MATVIPHKTIVLYEQQQEPPPHHSSGENLITVDVPSDANPYVEQAMDSLMEPVVSGVSKLKTPAQLSAISIAVVAMCEAWTNFIFKHKIRFR